jgi:hypothetical protein
VNPIGFSTGALALGDFNTALRSVIGKPLTAIELSALRFSELPHLLQAAASLDLRQFDYIALHAPSRFSQDQEPEIIRLLAGFPRRWRIILHPDTIHNHALWLELGQQVVIENMDRRKPDGRSVEELSRWFQLLPEAQLCLDLAHAQQWDTTMSEAYLLLKSFSKRLCQIHISQLDSASHHFPLSLSSIRAFSEVAWLIPEDVPFIIESRVSPAEIDDEIQKVQAIIRSARRETYRSIPA